MSQIETEAPGAIAQDTKGRFAFLKPACVLVPIAFMLVACAFLVSPGQFNFDEFAEFAGARAFLTTGSFVIPNGLPEFSSPDLNLWILVAGPHGLTPQYPAGFAMIGAPFLAAFGIRGLVLINVLAGVATLFVLWSLSKRHFGSTAVALTSVLLLLCGSFWLDYVFAIWPHSVSALCVALGVLFTLDSLKAEPLSDVKASLAAGTVIGFGFLFRTDTILALPAIGLATILFAKRPFHILTFVGLGLAPFVILTSVLNHARFGTFNPLSYGQTGGNTDLAAHLAPIGALALVSLLLVSLRFAKWRPARRDYVIGLLAIAALLVFSAEVRNFAQRYVAGAWALLVDSTTIHDPRTGVQAAPGGLLSFWGVWKKALGQSMPWLGLLFLAFHLRKDDELRRAQWVIVIFAGVWSLPFFMKSWHGGVGGNMRYFLPLVPLLCALCARYLMDFAKPIAESPRVLLYGALAGTISVALWSAFHPTREGGAQQILSTWILLTVSSLALLSGARWRGQGVVRVLCFGAIGAGLAASAFYMASDVQKSQSIRALTDRGSAISDALPDRTLAYMPPTMIVRWVLQPGHLAAMPDSLDDRFDYALIDKALAEHYRVLVWPLYVSKELRARYGDRLVPSGVVLPGGELLEVIPAAGRERS